MKRKQKWTFVVEPLAGNEPGYMVTSNTADMYDFYVMGRTPQAAFRKAAERFAQIQAASQESAK